MIKFGYYLAGNREAQNQVQSHTSDKPQQKGAVSRQVHVTPVKVQPPSSKDDRLSHQASSPTVIQLDASVAALAQRLLKAPLALELAQQKTNALNDPEYRAVLASLGISTSKIESILAIVHERELVKARLRMERLSKGSQTVEEILNQSSSIQHADAEFNSTIEAAIADTAKARTFLQWEGSLPFVKQARDFVSSLPGSLPTNASQAIANALMAANSQNLQTQSPSTPQLRQARLRQALQVYAPGVLSAQQQLLLIERYAKKVTIVR